MPEYFNGNNESNEITDLHDSQSSIGSMQKPPKKKSKGAVKLSLFWVIIIALLASILTFQITYIAQGKKYNDILNSEFSQNINYQLLSELNEIYEKNYVGELSAADIKDGILYGYVFGTNDKYGNYMSAVEYAEHTSTMSNSLVGIGISAIECTEPVGIEIVKVFKDSPAQNAGLIYGDIITALDGKTVAELTYNKAIDMIKGEKGTKLELTVLTPSTSQSKQITVTRESVTIDTVEHNVIQDNIGYVKITNFYENTPEELKAAVEYLKTLNVKGLVFDVRGNPGGRLDSIVSSLDYLLPEGVIIRMKDSSGKFTTESSDASFVDLPMTVLVNGSTASAAELFTSALMDYDKATVIGTQTYGKGTVTSPFRLSDGSWVYVSTQLYYPPKSENFEGVGITPDIPLELPEEYKNISLYKLTYEQDTQLQKAVEILKK